MKQVITHSKKGMSLVELIAVIAIMTVVIAASCVAMYSGTKSAADGQADYTSHSDAYLLETWLRKNLPTATEMGVTSHAESSAGAAEVLNLHFNSNGDFVVDKAGSGSVMNVSGIKKIVLKKVSAGSDEVLHYEITAADSGRSFVLSGGIVLNNISSSGSDQTALLSTDTTSCINIRK